MSVIECKDIDYVLAIERNGSISQAAEELYISQPALTKYLRSLESRIGIRLFVHNKRPMILTPEGEMYIRYAKEIAAIKNNLENELNRIKRKDYGLLRVGFASTGLREHIYQAAQDMRAEKFGTQINLSEMTSSDIEQKLINHQLDIGFITLPPRSDQVESQLILEEDLLLAVPASHPLASMGTTCYSKDFSTINLDRFSSDAFVLREVGTRFREYTDLLFEEAKFKPEISAIGRNNFSCLEFAEAWGYCSITTKTFVSSLKNPDSMRFFVAGPKPQKLFVGLACRKNEVMPLPACQFVDFVRASVAAQ